MAGPHILVVVSRFYPDIAEVLVTDATALLAEAGASYDVIDVPGAFEIPGAIAFACESGRYDGYVALGCVIRGETSHYEYVAGESARGLSMLAVGRHAAIGYGILTTEDREQAWERAKARQKGRDAARSCLAMVSHKQTFMAAQP